jgi:RHS repeat-associated protein
MMIIGCDLHTRYQQVAMLDTDTGELVERRLGKYGDRRDVHRFFQHNSTIRFRHYDWLGSARLESNMAENEYGDLAYAPFGESYAMLNTPYPSFTGQQQDTSTGHTGVYDFLYREYSAGEGRWISPDPAGMGAVDPSNPQTWNRYAYVLNSPLALVDPLGLWPKLGCVPSSDGFMCNTTPDQDGLGLGTLGNVFDLMNIPVTIETGIYTPPQPISTPIDSIYNQYGEAVSATIYIPGRWSWSNTVVGNGLDLFLASPANNDLHPTTVDKYNPMERGKTSLRDSNWFCSTHVTIDQTTGQTGSHVDLFNPEPTQNQPSPTLFWLHFIYDGTPDFIYRKTGMYLVPPGRGLCQ